MDPTHIVLLEQFVGVLKQKPEILHDSKLKFFRDYLTSLGAKIPSKPTASESAQGESPKTEKSAKPEPTAQEETTVEEDDIEKPDLDMTCVVVDENKEDVELPDVVGEDAVTDEMMDQSSDHRSAAMSALGDGNLEEALRLFTEAIKSNPNSANIIAKRASVLCKLKRPTAALKDCARALEINPDSAQAFMWQGRAHMLLGQFDDAQKSFSQSARIDSNEMLEDWIKENKSNADKMREYKVAVERQQKEREVKARQERVRRAREENERAAREAAESGQGGMPDFGAAGGFPGMGGMPGGMGGGMPGGMGGGMGGMGGLQDLFSDPEIMSAMQDPEVMTAFMDVQKDPNNISKYENNPKVQKVLERMATKFGGAAGGPDLGGDI